MTTVLVQTPGASISARGGRMVVASKDNVHEVPLGHVTELVVIGHARSSTSVIADLAGRGVPLHFHDREGSVPHSLLGGMDGQLGSLYTQLNTTPEQRLVPARALVIAKIENAQWVLRRLNATVDLASIKVHQAHDAAALRGQEGYAARQYFQAVAALLPGWEFTGRAYRPNPDPVNAALSFAYTVLLNWARVAVAHAGLHPSVGTLHVAHGRRPALALDIMEPFRARVCDLTVLGLLRTGQLPRDLFEQSGEDVRLGRAGCATVLQAVSRRIHDWKVNAALRRPLAAVQSGWAGGACECWHPPVRP